MNANGLPTTAIQQPQLSFSFGQLPPIKTRAEAEGEETPREKFEAFHRANPHVYDYFKQRAIGLRRLGTKRYGMKSLFELLRWDYSVQTGDPDNFKINNNFAPWYARLLMDNEPELDGFFETRACKYH